MTAGREGWRLHKPIDDAWYCFEKCECAMTALSFASGPLAERIFAAFSDGLRNLGGDTIPATWPEVRAAYAELVERVGAAQGRPLQASLSCKAEDELYAVAAAIETFCAEVRARILPN